MSSRGNDWEGPVRVIRHGAIKGIHYFEQLGEIQHNKFLAGIMGITIIILSVGLGTSEMTFGTIKYNLQGSNAVTTIKYDIGLWSFKNDDKTFSTCTDWPDEGSDLCASIRATRAFVFLAIISSAIGVVASVVRMAATEDFKAPMLASVMLLVTGVLTMIAYSIWQGNCQDQIGDEFQDEFYPNSTHNVHRRWATIGYSYALILWTWIWALSFLGLKLLNPSFNIFGCCSKKQDAIQA